MSEIRYDDESLAEPGFHNLAGPATERDILVVAERIAKAFHETYERMAPYYGYETREASAKPWSLVPDQNRSLMIEVVRQLLKDGVITAEPVDA